MFPMHFDVELSSVNMASRPPNDPQDRHVFDACRDHDVIMQVRESSQSITGLQSMANHVLVDAVDKLTGFLSCWYNGGRIVKLCRQKNVGKLRPNGSHQFIIVSTTCQWRSKDTWWVKLLLENNAPFLLKTSSPLNCTEICANRRFLSKGVHWNYLISYIYIMFFFVFLTYAIVFCLDTSYQPWLLK